MKEQIDNGVHAISNEQYHSSQGISRSALWTFKKSPALYWHQYLNPDYVKPEQTAAMLVGDLVHTLILEPTKFDSRYIIAPNVDRRTKTGKQTWEEFQEKANGKTIITRDQLELASKMTDFSVSNNTFYALLDGAKVEQSIYWTCNKTNLQFKSRPDIWYGSIVADLKTTIDATPRVFQHDIYKRGYHIQAAMAYRALESINIKMDKFVFCCVEKTPPYLDAIYILDDDSIQFALNEFDSLAELMAECTATNTWNGYGIQSIGLPEYVRRDNYEG